jgi:site-specific DNA-methyltransferase (adenine-specific)
LLGPSTNTAESKSFVKIVLNSKKSKQKIMNWSKKITVTHEDNMEMMGRYEDNYFDLAIVDPPYGINVKTRIFDDGKSWDNSIPTKEYFTELFRVSKNQIIWGGNYFLDYLKPTPCFLIWDKKMTDKHLMSMSEFAWTSFKTKNLIFRQPPPGDRGFYNIDGKRIHPTQKSVKLYKWILKNYAKPNDKILDTHLGSGSIALACHELNFELTACELDEQYYNDAYKRFKLETAQLRIF